MMSKTQAIFTKLDEMEAEGASIIDLMTAAGFDPKVDFRGGKWTFVDFSGLDLTGFDMRNCRLHQANFDDANVAGTNFSGADGVAHPKHPGITAARNWRSAVLDDQQRLILEYREFVQDPVGSLSPIEKFMESGLINESNYIHFMRQSGDYGLAKSIYDEVQKQGIEPNKYAVTELIILAANDDPLIDQIYREALDEKVEIDGILLNAMADAYSLPDNRKKLREKFKTNGVQIGEYFYNTLIKYEGSVAAASEIVAEMDREKIPVSSYTLNSVMSKARSWPDRFRIFESFPAREANVRFEVLNNLLKSARTRKEIRETLDLFRKYGIEQDFTTMNIRIQRRKNLNEAKHVFRELIEQGVKPDNYTQDALLTKASSFDEVCEVIGMMKPYEDKVNIFSETVIRELIRYSPDREWSTNRSNGIEMGGGSERDRAKALVAHWSDEKIRFERLTNLFPN